MKIKTTVSKGITTATVVDTKTGVVGLGQSMNGFTAISTAVSRAKSKNKVDKK